MWYNKDMNNDEIMDLVKRFCCMNEDELIETISSEIYRQKRSINIEHDSNYTYIKGDLPVLLVAHFDTFFDMPLPSMQDFEVQGDYILRTKYAFDSKRNAGFDDRAGIAMIYYIIKHGYLPSVLLCNHEEIGCWGAIEFIKTHSIEDCSFKFLIELDRSGARDAVYYDCANFDFINFINEYGFTTSRGSYTDIAVLAPMLQLAAVNLSIGYWREHSEEEMFVANYWYDTARKVCKILEDASSAEVDVFPYSTESRLSWLLSSSHYYDAY